VKWRGASAALIAGALWRAASSNGPSGQAAAFAAPERPSKYATLNQDSLNMGKTLKLSP
jgi:hypothetical protein